MKTSSIKMNFKEKRNTVNIYFEITYLVKKNNIVNTFIDKRVIEIDKRTKKFLLDYLKKVC